MSPPVSLCRLSPTRWDHPAPPPPGTEEPLGRVSFSHPLPTAFPSSATPASLAPSRSLRLVPRVFSPARARGARFLEVFPTPTVHAGSSSRSVQAAEMLRAGQIASLSPPPPTPGCSPSSRSLRLRGPTRYSYYIPVYFCTNNFLSFPSFLFFLFFPERFARIFIYTFFILSCTSPHYTYIGTLRLTGYRHFYLLPTFFSADF